MTNLTKQEQDAAVIFVVNEVLFDGRRKCDSIELGKDIAAALNANGFEIRRKEDEQS